MDDNRDTNKQATLIYIHGYNNDEEAARVFFKETFTRVYWQGFRGNFVGFSWHGNQGHVANLGETSLTFFKPNVTNAFQTAPTLLTFLREVAYSNTGAGWGLSPSHVDVMAHSLGNQVMWDAMRLNTFTNDGPVFNNAISIEAAIWEEAFEAEGPLSYEAPTSDAIQYSVDELKRMSWRSWFNQPGHNPRRSLAGHVFHSFKADDFALVDAMRMSDWLALGLAAPQHYTRLPGDYRSPSNMYGMPALMLPDQRKMQSQSSPFYTQWALSLPIGTRANPMADFNLDAGTAGLGWDDGEHSEHKDQDPEVIYAWYKRFLATPLTPLGEVDPSGAAPTAIAIGRE